MSRIEINLRPGKSGLREALRGLSNYTIRRENGFRIITIKIGDATIIVWVPP